MFWRRTPRTPEQDPTLPITPSPLSGRRPSRPSDSYLLATPVEAHPPPLPPKDHLREIYRPGPEYDEFEWFRGGVGAESGSGSEVMRERQSEQEGSWIRRSVIQIGPIVRERPRSSQGYKPLPEQDSIIDGSRSFTPLTLPSSPRPKSKPDGTSTSRPKVSQYLDEDQVVEIGGYLQELERSSIVNRREDEEDVLSPSSTKALRFFEIDQVPLNSRSKDEEEVLTFPSPPSSTRIIRARDSSCPQIELKLPPEGFSIDWSLMFN